MVRAMRFEPFTVIEVLYLYLLRWFWYGPHDSASGRFERVAGTFQVGGLLVRTASLEDARVQREYLLAGVGFARAVYDVELARPGELVLGVRGAYLKWLCLEERYLEHGYRALPFEAFSAFVKDGVPLPGVGVHRRFFEWPLRQAPRFERDHWSPLSVRHVGGH